MKKPSIDAYPESWLPKSARPDQKSEPELLNLHARIQDFLARIQPLSPDLRSHGRTRALALQKLHRICAREVRNLKAKFTLATVKYYLSQYRDAIRASDPNHLVLRPRRMRSGQRFSYLALDPEETRSLNAAYQSSIHRDQSKLIPLNADAFIEKARSLLSSSSYLEKGIALMALTGRRPGEIFFSAKFSLPKKKFPFPALIFEGQLKTRNAPGTSFLPYPIPVLAEPKLIIAELAKLRSLKPFPSLHAVHVTTSPQLSKYVPASFSSLDLPWKPGHLRSAYAAICCHRFKPKNMTDDIFIADILGHKLLPGSAALSVGQSHKDFYVT